MTKPVRTDTGCRPWGTALFALSLSLSVSLATAAAPDGADEAPPAEEAAADAEQKPQDAADEKPAKNKPDLDQKLLRSLGVQADDAASGGDDPIGKIVEGMRQAGKRISDDDTSPETREIQTQVVQNLDELLKLLKQQQQQQRQQQQQQQQQQQKPSSGEPQKPQPSSGQPKPGARQPGRPKTEEKPTAAPGSEGGGTRRQDNQKAQSSENRVDQAKAATAEAARRQEMEKDVWGHLPPAVRARLLNQYSDKFLPKYDEMVRRYYEALAERNRREARDPR